MTRPNTGDHGVAVAPDRHVVGPRIPLGSRSRATCWPGRAPAVPTPAIPVGRMCWWWERMTESLRAVASAARTRGATVPHPAAGRTVSASGNTAIVATESTCPVLVIGGGPVGLSMAIGLRRQGVGCTVVERHAGTLGFPKGRGVTLRTMDLPQLGDRRGGRAGGSETRGQAAHLLRFVVAGRRLRAAPGLRPAVESVQSD
jgi:hypothetical protein